MELDAQLFHDVLVTFPMPHVGRYAEFFVEALNDVQHERKLLSDTGYSLGDYIISMLEYASPELGSPGTARQMPLKVELHFEVYARQMLEHHFFQCFWHFNAAGMRKVCHRAASFTTFSRGDVVFSWVALSVFQCSLFDSK